MFRLVPAVDVLVPRLVNYSKIIEKFVELYERLLYFLLRTLPRGQIQVKLRDWKNVSLAQYGFELCRREFKYCRSVC